jgi:hypothetical protein
VHEPPRAGAPADRADVYFLLLLLLAFAMLLRAQPIWTMGQYQDDAVLSAYRAGYMAHGKGLWDFSVDMFASLVQNQGRVSPVSAFFVLPLWIWVEDNLFLYRLLQGASQLVALAAFALFVGTVTRDRLVALLSVALYVGFTEVRNFHDASHSYFILLPFVATIGWLGCHYAVRATRMAGRTFDRTVWMVVAFNALGALSYELAVPFAALSCLILLLWGELPWKSRLARAVVAGLPVLAMVVVGVIAKAMLSAYEGTKIGSFDGAVLGAAFGKHLSGALPLSYWWYDPHKLFEGLLAGTRSNPGSLLSATAVAAALGAITYVALKRARPETGWWRPLALAGVVLLLMPPLLIAVTLKYQREAVAGVGYLQNAISYFGAALLVLVALLAAARAAARVGSGPAFAVAALAGLAVGVAGATALIGSQRVAQVVNDGWRYPREQLEVWMQAVRPSLGDSPRVFAVERSWLQRWENEGFAWQHLQLHARFVTAAEAAATPPRDPVTTLRLPDHPHPAALNLYLDSAPAGPARRVRALVMSTSRERLADNALLLSAGAQSWPIPADVQRGRHGYHYRELVVEAPTAPLHDFRLTLAAPGAVAAVPAPAALAPPGPAKLEWTAGRFDDGWVADRFALRNAGGVRARVQIELWNATPRPRSYSLEGAGAPVRGKLGVDERKIESVELDPGQSLAGTVTPPYVPSQAGRGADERKLGLVVKAEMAAAAR